MVAAATRLCISCPAAGPWLRSGRPPWTDLPARRLARVYNRVLHYTRRETNTMTYCVGLVLNEGLVLAADSRTNAGVDYVTTFSTLHVFTPAPDRIFILGGQIAGQPHGLMLIYTQGNYFAASPETPYLQIGENKYGKPAIDCIAKPELSLADGPASALCPWMPPRDSMPRSARLSRWRSTPRIPSRSATTSSWTPTRRSSRQCLAHGTRGSIAPSKVSHGLPGRSRPRQPRLVPATSWDLPTINRKNIE